MKICVDFDGTCVSHEFPRVGKDIGAQRVLKKLVEQGHDLILFTMRGNVEEIKSSPREIPGIPGDHLKAAVDWFEKNNIPLYGINVNPTQHTWTNSPKAYGEIYIDDAALGIPLTYNIDISKKPFVDWNKVEKLLIERWVLLNDM